MSFMDGLLFIPLINDFWLALFPSWLIGLKQLFLDKIEKNSKGFLKIFSMPMDFLSRANLVCNYVSWKNDSIISCNAECIICT